MESVAKVVRPSGGGNRSHRDRGRPARFSATARRRQRDSLSETLTSFATPSACDGERSEGRETFGAVEWAFEIRYVFGVDRSHRDRGRPARFSATAKRRQRDGLSETLTSFATPSACAGERSEGRETFGAVEWAFEIRYVFGVDRSHRDRGRPARFSATAKRRQRDGLSETLTSFATSPACETFVS
jgi:hypothetical protein